MTSVPAVRPSAQCLTSTTITPMAIAPCSDSGAISDLRSTVWRCAQAGNELSRIWHNPGTMCVMVQEAFWRDGINSKLATVGKSALCRHFIAGMLEIRPQHRMSVEDALQHVWLRPVK